MIVQGERGGMGEGERERGGREGGREGGNERERDNKLIKLLRSKQEVNFEDFNLTLK